MVLLEYFILKYIEDEKQLYSFIIDLGYHIPNYYEPYITYQSQNQALYEIAQLTKIYKLTHTKSERKLCSNQISQNQNSEKISQAERWLSFFDEIVHKTHIPQFYDYSKQGKMLGAIF